VGPQGPAGPKGDPATPEDIVHVVWSDGSPGPGGEVMYKRDGARFDPTTINLSNTAGNSVLSSIAVISSNVYVVWVDGTIGNNDILYRRSTDGGATFGSTINLSNNVGFSWIPKIAASGNNVYVVWEDDTTGNNEILYKKSTDGGATFGTTVNLSNNAANSGQSAIAAAGNNVYVIWSDGTGGQADILYRVSTDGGTTFSGITNISNNPGFSRIPAIAASGNNVYVVWEDGNDILYRSSTDEGVIAVDGNSEILYRSSTDAGTAFEPSSTNLSKKAGFSITPAIAVS
jgi:hypothetical protein